MYRSPVGDAWLHHTASNISATSAIHAPTHAVSRIPLNGFLLPSRTSATTGTGIVSRIHAVAPERSRALKHARLSGPRGNPRVAAVELLRRRRRRRRRLQQLRVPPTVSLATRPARQIRAPSSRTDTGPSSARLPSTSGEDRFPAERGSGRPANCGIASFPCCPTAARLFEEISRLIGHKSTTVTELVYRKQIRPVVQSGADAMDRIFGPAKDAQSRS